MSELRQAFGRGQLVLHHQPKLDPATGEATSVEALVRWQHPERGLLLPDAFVPFRRARTVGGVDGVLERVLG